MWNWGAISKKLGFTETEFKIILFLISTFLAGVILNHFIVLNDDFEYQEFDYSKEDSIFNAIEPEALVVEKSESDIEKNVDSQQELLDFGVNKITGVKSPELNIKNDAINLNSASVAELISLPGIGKKTANRIIEQRNILGKFTSIEDLLEVKGIGKRKLDKIRKYIFLE